MTPRAVKAYVEPTPLERLGYDQPAPDAYRLYFPWARNPLPANDGHGHWRARAAKEKSVREATELRILTAKVPHMDYLRAQVTWWVNDRRIRDADNLGPIEKRMFDAIVRAGLIADDHPGLMDKPRGRIRHIGDAGDEAPVTHACFVLTITRLHEAPDA